jgi:hypothetical protein
MLNKRVKNKLKPINNTEGYELADERLKTIYPFWSTPITFIPAFFITIPAIHGKNAR